MIKNRIRSSLDRFGRTWFGHYLYRVLIAISVIINVVLFFGESNQSFSARNYQWKREGKLNLCWLIDACTFDDCHCLKFWAYWYVRRQKLWEDELIYDMKLLTTQQKSSNILLEQFQQRGIYDEYFQQGDPDGR